MSAPQTIAEAVHMIDELQAELDRAHATIEILRSERNTWRSASGR